MAKPPALENQWFDDKYQSTKTQGLRPSLEEVTQLICQLQLPKLPARISREITDKLKFYLHELRRTYTPSTHVLVHKLLFCFAPMADIEKGEYQRYIDEYRAALDKHKGEVVFSCNFR